MDSPPAWKSVTQWSMGDRILPPPTVARLRWERGRSSDSLGPSVTRDFPTTHCRKNLEIAIHSESGGWWTGKSPARKSLGRRGNRKQQEREATIRLSRRPPLYLRPLSAHPAASILRQVRDLLPQPRQGQVFR